MRSMSWIRIAGAVALAFAATALGATRASAKPVRPTRPRALNLFALPVHVMNVNRVDCPITNNGQVCVDSTQSPVLEGAFWPKGTPDSYVFNSGLQIGGVIPSTAGFAWAGDTVGVFFMDPRGDQLEGDGLTNIYTSLDPNDAANWPNGGVVRDTSIYNSALLGRNSISQEDLWVRLWDGNPALLAGRTHPMGIAVEERGLAWNFPTGNEDIVYFIYTFYNVTASDCTVYNNPTIDPAIQAEICAVGQQFQAVNGQRFGITFPAGGWSFTSLFAAFFEDCDVGEATHNYSTPDLVFNMGFCYKSDFNEAPDNWVFPPDAFAPPQVTAPGFTGTKYLRSPVGNSGQQLGLTLFSNTLNSGTGYPDPLGVKQMYRYISGTSNPPAGDNPCLFQGQQLARRYCYLASQPFDTRFFMSSGPFTLPPGQARTLVVAYMFAAPDSQVATFLAAGGTDFKPGLPPSDTGLVTGSSQARAIDSATGWVTQRDVNGDGKIEQNEVTVVPRSLLNKALVAQAVFDNKFLLPFAPEPPNFFLIPGDNQVTVTWQKSNTEAVGDPFFVVASDRTSPLYDPNFRQFDVEGYRIYRGRTSGALQLIAQFDYAGTVITDYTGGFDYGTGCAPELGVQGGCPVTFDTGTAIVVPTSPHVDHPLIGSVVQVLPGGRVKLADGSVLLLKGDTAVTGGNSGNSALKDTGVPFAFVDHGAKNSFSYFYSVTAYDVNSFKSGPSSLESPRITKSVTPRKASGQETAGSITTPVIVSSRGDTLDPTLPDQTVDATTGELSGPAAPTNGFQTSLAVFVPQLLSSGSVAVKIDSVIPGNSDPLGLGTAAPTLYYITSVGPTGASAAVIPLNVDGFSADSTTTRFVPVTGVDKTKVGRFGGDSTFAMYASVTMTSPGTWRTESYGRASINGDPGSSDFNGPRWWTGAANENTPDPNSSLCSPAAGGCVDAAFNNRTNTKTAGSLPGVLIFHPQAYSTVQSSPMRTLEPVLATVTRAADFKVYWGTAGALDSVIDVTHKMPVPFGANIGPSWGFMNDSSFVGVPQASTPDANNNLLTWSDIFCVAPAPAFTTKCGAGATAAAKFQNHARLSAIADTSSLFAGTSSLVATGNGFIIYVAGQFFLMQMSALPSAGTVWNLRTYAGNVVGTTGTYSFQAADVRPAAIPGLQAKFQFVGSTFDPTKTNDSVLARVHTVPDPYYVTDALEFTPNSKILKFVNLPAECIIRVYSTSGILVQVITHNDPTGGGEATWNLRNRNNQFVASGVYFYHIEAPDGKSKVGRFTIINFAP